MHNNNKIKLNNLTPEEERVIIYKGTESPYTGELLDEKRAGTFICRHCNAPLYYSEMKFDSGCGRPSFDDAIPGQVHESVDADGRRTEITCESCGGHLGHVFRGEQFTDKDTRHCVNSISMKFVPEKIELAQHQADKTPSIATFGGGCYRCIEAVMQRLKGVIAVESGFMGGRTTNPTYEDISYADTGHIEVVQVQYDSEIISYQTLLSVFFSSHDPTQLDRQGNDVGSQYASVIFTHTPEQKIQAETMISQLHDSRIYFPDTIVTVVREATEFWKGPEYHQNYYNQNSEARYCQYIINPKIKKLRERYADLLKNEYHE